MEKKTMSGGGRVYVGSLPDTADKRELEVEFGKYGACRVWVARNPPGFAFVEYDDPKDADDAVHELDGREICGVKARVESARGPRGSGRRRDDYYRGDSRRDGGRGGRDDYRERRGRDDYDRRGGRRDDRERTDDRYEDRYQSRDEDRRTSRYGEDSRREYRRDDRGSGRDSDRGREERGREDRGREDRGRDDRGRDDRGRDEGSGRRSDSRDDRGRSSSAEREEKIE
eukprot:m.67790 g.67790  ORF g.67790 m.67790 type:complete len:228 (-) comp8227_c2_seq3:2499-3182(-)